jgi:hypothetical protein
MNRNTAAHAVPPGTPGGPVLQPLPHHRYVCTRQRIWIGPPDVLDLPYPSLDDLPEVVAATRAPAVAAPSRTGPTTPKVNQHSRDRDSAAPAGSQSTAAAAAASSTTATSAPVLVRDFLQSGSA